jgi:uncharacterized protein
MMSPEERQLLTGLFDRIRTAAASPRDSEAEALIAEAVRNQPYAPYLLAQAVIVQDQALQAANAKIEDLENELRDEGPPQQPGSGGFLGSIFGASAPRPAPQPSGGPWGAQQNYAPPPGGPWSGAPMSGAPMGGPIGGGSFLQGALGTAAGVAGGVLLANSISSLFGAHNNPFGIGTGGGLGGGETIVNNYYESPDSHVANADYQDASFDDSAGDFGPGDDGSQDV